jgi:hypothetical protein
VATKEIPKIKFEKRKSEVYFLTSQQLVTKKVAAKNYIFCSDYKLILLYCTSLISTALTSISKSCSCGFFSGVISKKFPKLLE